MEARVIEFANILRRNGIRVSLSENMDAFRALELLGIADPLLFRNALRTTLIKRTGDVRSPSTNCSIISFSASARRSTPSTARSWKSSGSRPSSFRRCSNRSRNCLKKWKGILSDLTKALLKNNRAELERLLREAMQQEMQNGTPESMRHTPYTRMMMRLAARPGAERDRALQRHAADARRERRRSAKRHALSGRAHARLEPAVARDHPAGAAQAGRRAARLRASAAPWPTRVFPFTPKTISGA